MKYRIYVSGINGYYNLGTYNIEETIDCLDWLIMEQQTKEYVLVIECNIQDRIEFPVFLYLGNIEDYELFKEYLNIDTKDKVTKSYKKRW